MIVDAISKVKNLFRTRSFAYNQVFVRGNKYSEDVLKDLAKFCRAHESTFDADPRIHAVLEGRKEVWLRIQNHLQLDSEELFAIHKVKDLPREK